MIGKQDRGAWHLVNRLLGETRERERESPRRGGGGEWHRIGKLYYIDATPRTHAM